MSHLADAFGATLRPVPAERSMDTLSTAKNRAAGPGLPDDQLGHCQARRSAEFHYELRVAAALSSVRRLHSAMTRARLLRLPTYAGSCQQARMTVW